MKKTRFIFVLKRVVCFLLIFIMLFTGVSMLGSAIAFRVMFGRVDVLPVYVEIPYSSLDTVRYPRESISFLSGENRLAGYLYGGGERGLVVVAPGINSNSETHLAEIMFFVDSGFSVLAYTGTGCCESEGEGVVGLQQSKLDLLAALDFASSDSRTASLPVILYGHSLGGYAAAASLSEAPRVRGAVCVAGFDRPVDMMYRKARSYVGFVADVEFPFLYWQNVLIFGDDADSSAVESINSVDTPVLIVQGSTDSVVSDDVSLYSHREELTNPNVTLMSVSEPNRSGHRSVWLSNSAAGYVAERQRELEQLDRKSADGLPQSELTAFCASVDIKRATELDESFKKQVLDLCDKCLK